MPKREFISLLITLGLAAWIVNGQLEPDCNPLHTECPAKKAWPTENYYIDFTKQTGSPDHWILANNEVVNFSPKGAEFTYGKKGDSPNMWTDFYILGGRYDVEMQIAPGQGIISNSVLWSDVQDEIDWEFSGNQHGEKPFPPPDGKWIVETNIFAQGKMWDGAATYQKDVVNPTTQIHTYSVEWDESHISWYVDNQVVRSVQASNTPSGFIFPQTPMKLQLGVWGGGDPSNNYWTIQWAGGDIDMKGVPYTMYVRSVNITNKYPACQYKYTDKTGKIAGIDKIQDGCGSLSATASASATSPKIVNKNNPAGETHTPIELVASYPVGAGSAVSSSSVDSLPPGSPLSSTVTSRSGSASSSASSTASSVPTPLVGSDGYPVASSPISVPTTPLPIVSSYPVSPLSSSSKSTHLVSSGYPVASSPISVPTTPLPIVSSYPVSSLTTSSKLTPLVSSGYPVSSLSVSSKSTHLVGSGYPVSSLATSSESTPSVGSGGYPVASSAASSKHTTPLVSASSYPVASASSSGGFLSSLSSLILGTSSRVSSITITMSTSHSDGAYPVTPITTSTIPLISSSVAHSNGSVSASGAPGSSSTGTTSSGATSTTSSGYPVLPGVSNMTSTLSSPLATGSLSSSSFASSHSTSGSLVSSTTSSEVMPSTYTFSSEITTSFLSTVYSTNIVTITSCAATVKNCPVGQVTTQTVSLYTTICPVTHTIIDGKTFSGKVDSTTSAVSSTPMPSSSYPVSSQSSTSPLSSETPVTSLVPSAGTSSPAFVSSGIYHNTTMPALVSSVIYQNTTSATARGTSTAIQSPSGTPTLLTTSTVYSTNVYTITSCAATVTNCPARLGQVTTELVSLYTTVCPVEEQGSTGVQETSALPVSTSASVPAQYSTAPLSLSSSVSSPVVLTTSTVYSSTVYTVSSCAPGATECASSIGLVTTELVPLYTTVCPVKDNPTTSTSSAGPKISQTGHEQPSSVISGASSTLATTPVPTPGTPVYTTSTVYSTNVYTVTSCAPDVTNCPAVIGSVTTEIIAVSTTVCPVSDKTVPAAVTSTEVTISKTFSNSVVVITSIITFIDTPPPYSATPVISTANTAGTGTVPALSGTHTSAAQPCTTLTLGSYYTTVITYASLTQHPPASVSPGSILTSFYTAPGEDVPSYPMTEIASTVEMSGHSTIVKTVTQGYPGEGGQCICEPATSTVYATMTMTVAETTITSTKTIEPPFPSTYGTGTGTGTALGTGTRPMSTGGVVRRWFRRAQVGMDTDTDTDTAINDDIRSHEK